MALKWKEKNAKDQSALKYVSSGLVTQTGLQSGPDLTHQIWTIMRPSIHMVSNSTLQIALCNV